MSAPLPLLSLLLSYTNSSQLSLSNGFSHLPVYLHSNTMQEVLALYAAAAVEAGQQALAAQDCSSVPTAAGTEQEACEGSRGGAGAQGLHSNARTCSSESISDGLRLIMAQGLDPYDLTGGALRVHSPF